MVYLEKYKEDIYTCNRTRCGFCRDGCPVYEDMLFESYTSRGKMILARAFLEGVIKPSEELMNVLYACTTCGYCKVRCALDTVRIFEAFRAELVNLGLKDMYHERVLQFINENGNPYGRDKKERSGWANGIRFDNSSDTLFFAGCGYSYEFPDAIRCAALTLINAGVELKYLGAEEPCCNHFSKTTGHWETFTEYVKKNYKMFKSEGVKRIITSCPACFKAFSQEYPEFLPEFDIEVLHYSQVLVKLLDEGKLKPKNEIKMKVAYHDPCHLGRHMKIFEEPREILNKIPGLEVIEFERNRYESYCCGGGGGLFATRPDISMRIAYRRIAEVADRGIDAIVTICPTCESILKRAVEYEELNIKVLDLAELVYQSCMKKEK
ncbi:MAG: (Fe-S)-binding protein [Candidatus Baldrarchaeia archaeon]